MSNWQKVNKVANILNIGKNFLRTIICREEFKDYVADEKPLLINCCDEFEELIKNYIKNIKINKNKRRIKKRKLKQYQKKHIIVKENILKGWTQTAIDCYNIGCNCNKCELKNIISSECCMKQTILLLVKKFGAPNVERNDIL